MCLICQGWSPEEVRAEMVAQIDRFGWAVQYVDAGRGSPPFAYSVGLTRFHGHPELLVSGLPPQDAGTLLDELGNHVRDGKRFTAGDVIISCSPHRYRVLRINDPSRLVAAQEIYGARGAVVVPGLQVVWSSHDGLWPWDSAWPDGRRLQHVLGHPRPPPY